MEKVPWRALGAEQREARDLAALMKSVWGKRPLYWNREGLPKWVTEDQVAARGD